MKDDPVKTAVVTGGHSYAVVSLRRLFRSLDGIEPHVQHMDDFASSSQEVKEGSDQSRILVVASFVGSPDRPVAGLATGTVAP